MTTETNLPEIFNTEMSIINGPDRTTLMFSLFEGSRVFFNIEGYKKKVEFILWGVKCNDTDRRYWTIAGVIVYSLGRTEEVSISVAGSYWMRDGKREGYLNRV